MVHNMDINGLLTQAKDLIFMNQWTEGIFFAIAAIIVLKVFRIAMKTVIPVAIFIGIVVGLGAYVKSGNISQGSIRNIVNSVSHIGDSLINKAQQMHSANSQ